MLGSSGAGARESGPQKLDKKKTPRRKRVRVLASVGAVIVAVAAIAATTWALSRNSEDTTALPPIDDTASESVTPSDDSTAWALEEDPSPTAPFSLPSFPTQSPTTTPKTTAPSLTFPTPSTTSSHYTPPAYTPPTYNPPATTPTVVTPTTTPPTTSPTTPPAAIKVRPKAPRVTRITECGTWGSVRVTPVTGVRYRGTIGGRLEGKWVVTASARKGYVIASGATTRWSGNLGKHRPCPGDPTIDEVTKVSTGDPEPGAWDLTVATTVPGTTDRELVLTFTFGSEARVVGSRGDGWSCQDVADPVPAGTPISCTYTGDAPPDVTLGVVALDDTDQPVEPHGSLTLSTDGTVTDDATF